jgi:hypothetical protein
VPLSETTGSELPDLWPGPEASIRQPQSISDALWRPAFRTIPQAISPFFYYGSLVSLLMLCLFGLGFSGGIPVTYGNFSGGPIKFKYAAFLEPFQWLCFVGIFLLYCKLLADLGRDPRIAGSFCCSFVVVGFVAAGLSLIAGLEAANCARPYLPLVQGPVGQSIGKTVMSSPP